LSLAGGISANMRVNNDRKKGSPNVGWAWAIFKTNNQGIKEITSYLKPGFGKHHRLGVVSRFLNVAGGIGTANYLGDD
jgi:hypothetical protein